MKGWRRGGEQHHHDGVEEEEEEEKMSFRLLTHPVMASWGQGGMYTLSQVPHHPHY